MCGFVGYINRKEKNKDIIRNMNKRIIHRGPDDESYYEDSNIALAFRRLSIIDLSGGRQPMFNEDKTMVITFNGEIYNFQELKKDLMGKGHIFKNNSDTEVIIHGYEEYGEDILNKLRGMFGFVIWDIKNRKLFGARDHFGQKPFYYTKMNDTFMFGSEIKSFLDHPDFKKEINKNALKPYLTFQYPVLEETFFKDVYRLKPGHYIKYENGEITVKRYFEYEFKPQKQDFETLKKEIHEDVHSSIKYHRISDVKVGSFLSGGVDSSYVVSDFKPNETFSVGFDYEKFNETNYAKELSDILGIHNERKLITSEEFFNVLPEVQYHSDEPHANLSAVPLYFLSELARRDVTVVLSGEGADELFGGYEAYYTSPIFNKYRKLPFVFRKLVKNVVEKVPYFKGQGFLIKGGQKLEDYYIGQAFIFDDKGANEVLQEKYKSNLTFKDITKPIFDKVKDYDEVSKMQYLDMHLWLPNDILLKADKMTMAHSLELRVPFLDKEVFKRSLTIPNEYKIANGTTKYIFRKASEAVVPSEWANRKKKGFPVPFSIWLKEEKYYNKVKEAFNSAYAKEFFNIELINNILDKHYKGEENTGRKVYTIYSFLVWYKKYFIDIR